MTLSAIRALPFGPLLLTVAWLGCVPLANGRLLAEEQLLKPTGALQPWSENPWFWSFQNQPVMLLGGSDDDNLFQWPKEKLLAQLDRIRAAGGNYVRNTMSDRQDAGFEVYPFLQLENGKYDLTKWNPEYWSRFEFFLEQTAKRQIFVQIEVWDRFDYTDNRASDSDRWQKHPYNPQNNINYTAEETGLARRYPEHPGQNKQPFFFSTPEQRNITPLLEIQRAFVLEMLRHSLAHDHILYCIDNETRAEPAWGEYWANLIRTSAADRNKRVEVTEMWDDWNLKAERHRQTFDRPELYSFVDVSQNNHNSGQEHWDNFQFVRNLLAPHPRPINTTKTYGADGNKFGHSDQDAIERFWRHLLGGAASVRFHRPDSGLGINDRAVACLKAARAIESQVPYWNLKPAQDVLEDCAPNEGFAAATNDRATIVIFFPKLREGRERGSVRLASAESAARWQAKWIDIDRGQQVATSEISSGIVEPMADANLALVLRRTDRAMFGGEVFSLGDYRAFVFQPERQSTDSAGKAAWVMYAPTLLPNYPDEHERWLHRQLLDAGVAIAGIDVGEAFGSPECVAAQTRLYDYLTTQRGFSLRPCVLGRSRGGLWQASWAARNPDKLAGIGGIYPVFDLRSYPGLERAAGAYGLAPASLEQQLPQLNPLALADDLAQKPVPVYIIHGNQDTVVPLVENSAALHKKYEVAGNASAMTLEVVEGQGHNYWPGYFRCEGLADFLIERSQAD